VKLAGTLAAKKIAPKSADYRFCASVCDYMRKIACAAAARRCCSCKTL
jgi:hypothetical protein